MPLVRGDGEPRGCADVKTYALTSCVDLKDVLLTNVDLMLCVDESSMGTLGMTNMEWLSMMEF